MAGSPQFKVYDPSGAYIAACKQPQDAAALASINGAGSKVKLGHSSVLWHEGAEEIPASESYDRAGAIIRARATEVRHRAFARVYGEKKLAEALAERKDKHTDKAKS